MGNPLIAAYEGLGKESEEKKDIPFTPEELGLTEDDLGGLIGHLADEGTKYDEITAIVCGIAVGIRYMEAKQE